MRWTVPTLIYTLYINGLKLETAGDIVAATYPLTQGDDDFTGASWVTDSPTVVGPYALYEAIRGDYPQEAPTHAGADARTIVAAMRGYDGQIADIVDIDVPRDAIVLEAVKQTIDFIRAGGTVEPKEVDDSTDTLRAVQLQGRRLTDQAAVVGNLFDTMFRQ